MFLLPFWAISSFDLLVVPRDLYCWSVIFSPLPRAHCKVSLEPARRRAGETAS